MPISKRNNYLILLVYLSIILGFIINEDTLGGAFADYNSLDHVAHKFYDNFIKTLLNYDDLNHRQSPIFYIFKSFFLDFNENFQRLIFLHIFLLIPFIFYKCLKLKFKSINKNNLKLIACLIILFPTFRSYAIWPDPHLMGTLFFLLAIYYYLKFLKKNNDLKFAILNTLYLSLSAYFSPNFGVFVVFFIYEFYKYFNYSSKLILILFFNLILSLPFFYFLFVLNVDFIFDNSHWDIGKNFYSFNNFSNKIIIVSSLIFFYIIPFSLSISKKISYKFLIKNKYYFLCSIMIFFLACFYFDFEDVYRLTNSGGGFFYNLSNLIFGNNFLLFAICFFITLYLTKIFIENPKNLILFFVLLFSNPQLTLWQANYSPTIFILLYLIFNLQLDENKINRKFIIFQYLFFSGYLIANYFYKYDINNLTL